MDTVNIESEKKEVLRSIEEFLAAEKRKDTEGILELFADDFVIVLGNSKMVEGTAALRELVKGTLKNLIDAKHFPLRVEVSSSGDMAWLLAYEIMKSKRQEGIVERKTPYMVAFRKEDGKWKWAAACEAQGIKV